MNLRNQFKRSFSYTWYLYVLAIVVPCVAFPIAYSFMHRPQEYEKLSLFVSGPIKDDSLSLILENKFKDSGVKTVELISFDYQDNETMYLKKLNVVGINRCDVLIIPESYLYTINPEGCMIEFNDEIKELCAASEETYYQYENKDFAVELTSKSPLGSFVSLNDSMKYYAFLGGKSWNVGNYSSKRPNTENAFGLISYIVG